MKGICITFLLLLTMSVITKGNNGDVTPVPIKQTITLQENGVQRLQTEITFDKKTSREDIINSCNFLAKENISLVFDKLEIKRPYFGLFGKYRIGFVEGFVELPDGMREKFKAGGLFAFRSVKIIYSKDVQTNAYRMEMVEIID